VFAIEVEPVGLAIRNVRAADVWPFVPVEAEPFEVGNKLIFEAGFTAFDVGIFDAQDHGAVLLARKKPVEQSGTGVPDMQMTGGGRGEARTDWGIRAHKMMLTGEREGHHLRRRRLTELFLEKMQI
jgi:hypothetical protein